MNAIYFRFVVILLLTSPASAALLVSIEHAGGKPGTGLTPTAEVPFGTGNGEHSWTVYATTADVGRTYTAPQEMVNAFNLVDDRTSLYTVFHEDYMGTWRAPVDQTVIQWSLKRYIPVGESLDAYRLTELTNTIDSLTWTPYGANQWRVSGHMTLRFYGELVPAVPGDFNQNGEVDSADYVLWRNMDGQAATLPNESGLNLGSVDIEDYWHWKANFGHLPAATGAATIAIPEPRSATTALLIAFATVLSPARHIFRRKQQ